MWPIVSACASTYQSIFIWVKWPIRLLVCESLFRGLNMGHKFCQWESVAILNRCYFHLPANGDPIFNPSPPQQQQKIPEFKHVPHLQAVLQKQEFQINQFKIKVSKIKSKISKKSKRYILQTFATPCYVIYFYFFFSS